MDPLVAARGLAGDFVAASNRTAGAYLLMVRL
jgi:hypothetical protein